MSRVRITVAIESLNKHFRELGELNIKKKEDLDTVKYRAASMDIFTIINKTIDIADEVALEKSLGFPAEYKEVFTMLKNARIIDEKMEKKLKDLVMLRNKISHRYDILTEKDIFNAVKEVEIIKDFVECVKRSLNGKK